MTPAITTKLRDETSPLSPYNGKSPGVMLTPTSDFEKSSSNGSVVSSSTGTTSNNASFVIHPPMTQGDSGQPSSSLKKDVDRVLALIQDERHMVAHELSLSVQARIASHQSTTEASSPTAPSTPPRTNVSNQSQKKGGLFHRRSNRRPSKATPPPISPAAAAANAAKERDYQAAQTLWMSKQNEIDKLRNRVRLFERAKHNLSENDNWTLSQTLFGITTYYRREPDSSLSIKLEGKVSNVPLFEQIAVLKEVDLYYKWAPFCTSSLSIKQLDKLDVLGWMVVGLPNFGLMRDGVFRAIGCDCMKENGTILLVGQGVADRKPGSSNATTDDDNDTTNGLLPPQDTFLSEDPALPMEDIPPVPTRLGAGRMTIKNFDAMVEVLSPTEAHTKLISNVNPNLDFVPQSLLEFIMKKMVGILLNKLQGAARKVQKHPVQNVHARRMRQEHQFYKNWLYPKFESFCKENGWEMLPVPALDLTDEQQEQDFLLYGSDEGGYMSISDEGRGQRLSRSDTELPSSSDDRIISARTPSNISEYPYLNDNDLTNNHDTASQVSDLSSMSTWSKNPISSYLHEIEARTQRRKNQKIMAARMRAANRLKRKSLTPQQKERLHRLKDIKRKRKKEIQYRELGCDIMDDDDTESAMKKGTENLSRFLFSLHCYSPARRYQIMIGSFGFMVILLYFTSIVKISPPILTSPSNKWWVSMLRDVGTILYLSSCAAVHFVCCKVALVYAFESLELGGKTGGKSKKYYSNQLQIPVALFSIGIVLFSIAKALASYWSRFMLWYTLHTTHVTKDMIVGLYNTVMAKIVDMVPFVSPAVSLAENTVYWGFHTLMFSVDKATALTTAIIDMLSSIAIRSHWLGRTIEAIILWIVSTYQNTWKSFVQDAIAHGEGRVEFVSWRFNAIETSKFALVHTAIFLLTTLFLFNASAKKASNKTKTSVEDSTRKTRSFEMPRGRTVSDGEVLTSGFMVSPLGISGVESTTAATTTSRDHFFRENETIVEGDDEEAEEGERKHDSTGPLFSPPSYANRFPKSTSDDVKKEKKPLFKSLLRKKNRKRLNKVSDDNRVMDDNYTHDNDTIISEPRSRAATVDF